jgi:oligoendopeptidase F
VAVTARAEDVRWDLSDLCSSADDARAQIGALAERATAFGERYHGRIETLDAPGLRALLDELDELEQDRNRLQVYVSARLNLDTADPEANDLATFGRDRASEIESKLVFAGIEWLALDDARADELLAAEELEPYAHKLRVGRDEKPYVKSEPEEQALNTRQPAVSSWQSLHDRQVATIEVDFRGEPHSITRLLSYMHETDRELRRAALDVMYKAGLEPRADVLASAYDAIVGDRLGVDRLRGYADPMQPTNMSNELDGETVEAMMTATEESYGIARRWFELKAGLLGIEKLELADQYAPLGESRKIPWSEGVHMVDTSFSRFSPRLAEIFRACLEAGHVDAAPRPGKVGGAYCTPVSKRVLPYVLMNYTDRFRDVTTLSHEFGHATHAALSLERQTFQSHRTGLALAEVPSTFAQLLTDDYLLETESDQSTRAAVAVDRLENAFAAVFRQVTMARFEQSAYRVRAEGLALTAERLSDLWLEQNTRYYGDSLILPQGYRLGWSYIPHFIHVRFYTYAYSFAQLVALLLHRLYAQDPEGFVGLYLDLLGKGGSASPAELLAPFGLDLRSADTWREAFAELESQLDEAAALTVKN